MNLTRFAVLFKSAQGMRLMKVERTKATARIL